MHIDRNWATPLTVGAFGLLATTGVLMFFHLDTGLNKTAHEWLSWAMLGGVVLHALLNLPAFKRYFTQTTGRVVMGAFALVLALSFLSLGGKGGKEPGFAPPVRALAAAPIPVLAQVAGTDAGEIFVAGRGDDLMTGMGGADIFYCGEGKDEVRVSDLAFLRVHGGEGQDTLTLTGAGLTLDLGAHLAIGFITAAVFILMDRFSTIFSTKGNFPPIIAAWLPDVIFSFVAIYLYRKSPK